jgi:hypothetical protein
MLTNNQFDMINNIIIHKETTFELRENVNKILYTSFENWSKSKAYNFKQFHYYKCRHIPLNELKMYASIGLYRGIQKYKGIPRERINPKTLHFAYFIHYVNYHITNQLYNGMTELQPISLHYPKGVKMKKGCKKLNEIELINDREWLFNEIKENLYLHTIENIDDLYNYEKVVRKIDSLSPVNKRILRYMFNDQFVKINSKQKVARFMGVSDETIRIRLIEIRETLEKLN